MRPVGIIPGIFWDKMGQYGIVWDISTIIGGHNHHLPFGGFWGQRWENDEGLAGIMMGNTLW